MKKNLIIALTLAAPACVAAQTAVDAMSLTQNDLRGTARFMSMAGAFTALGGDMSTLNQNPGGIGVYRSSDVSLTLDLNPQSVKSVAGGYEDKTTQTKFGVNSFGYIGAVNTGSQTMPFFNWGVSYSRAASFDRSYGGRLGNIGTSYTNLVADYTNFDGFSQGVLGDKNAYANGDAPWTSILMYDGFGINPSAPGSDQFVGLYDYDATVGEGWYNINEKGHVDEYSINFGGNVMDILYWGIGFGITDIDFKQYAYYGESFYDCNVPSYRQDQATGEMNYSYIAPDLNNETPNTGDYGLTNYKHIWGSGFNFKAGVIVKPINEFRIGIAVHTPTYYNLSYEGNATMAYGYDSPLYSKSESELLGNGETSTEWSGFDWKFQSPWRLMIGAAGVIGGRAIISADYEYRAYSNMSVKDWEGYSYTDVNNDIKNYYQSTSIIRLGAEYRLTPSWSIRAGYSYETSPIKGEMLDNSGDQPQYVYTSGPFDDETQPSYTFNRSTSHVTCGVGYKYKNLYADLAYVYRHRSADYHAFTDYIENTDPYSLVMAPKASLSDNTSQIVLTLGVRF